MTKTKLTRQIGWVRVFKAENALINEQFSDKAASGKAVWLALLILSNDRKEHGKEPEQFAVNISLIKNIAGVSYKTTQRMLEQLKDIGLIEIPVRGKSKKEPNTYKLKRIESPSDLITQVNDEASDCPTSLKKYKNKDNNSLSSSSELSVNKNNQSADPLSSIGTFNQQPRKW